MTPDDELSTLLVTRRERRMITHALAVAAAMQQALEDDGNTQGDGGRALIALWNRVQPADESVES